MNKYYYIETNADKMLVVTATDDETVAAWFSVDDYAEARNADTSNIDGMTADEIRAFYPEHVFTFDPDSDDFELVTEILPFKEDRTMIDIKYFNEAVALMDEEIREEIHAEGKCETEEQFLREYEARHLAKYGEEFTI